MARDRFDDENADDRRDDRDRGERGRGERGRDDGYDRDETNDRAGRGQPVASRTKTGVPAVLLMICAVLSGGLIAYNVYVAATEPDQLVKQYGEQIRVIEATQPAGPQRDQQVKILAIFRDNAQLDSPPILALIAFWTLVSGLMLLGGFMLYTRGVYGLAMTGAVAALIPCTNNLVCLAMPVGLYALIVLLMSDVKAAFQANRRRPAVRDEDA